MVLRHADLLGSQQGGFILAFAIVVVKKDVVIPAGMMPVEVHRSLHQTHAALPVASEGKHGRQVGYGGPVPRIECNPRSTVSRNAVKSRLRNCTAASSFQPDWQAGSILTARHAASRARSNGSSRAGA